MTGWLRLPGSELVGRGRPQDTSSPKSHHTLQYTIVKTGNYCTRSHSQANVAFVAIDIDCYSRVF